MTSLTSANGPSITVLFLPLTVLPARSSGRPWSLMWPFSARSLSQVIHFCIDSCQSSGERPPSPPRYRKTYSLMVCLLQFRSGISGFRVCNVRPAVLRTGFFGGPAPWLPLVYVIGERGGIRKRTRLGPRYGFVHFLPDRAAAPLEFFPIG